MVEVSCGANSRRRPFGICEDDEGDGGDSSGPGVGDGGREVPVS